MLSKLRRLWRWWTRPAPYWFVPYFTDREPEYIDFDTVASFVGPGWRNILAELTKKLFRLGWDGGLLQVKEKFGGLRFYWQNNIQDPTLASIANDVVEVAEWRSTQTCDRCGKYGKTRGGGWIYTLCDEHWEETLAARAGRDKESGVE